MAGKRQHYVPRFLQRGFLNDRADEGERTWLHRRGATPRLVGIGDIGVEDWFYSRRSPDGSRTLDDAITDLERVLGPIIGNWRNAQPDTSVDSEIAAMTVVHLVFRTAHLRRIFSSGMSRMMGEVEALFTDRSRLAALLGLNALTLTSTIADVISNGATEMEASGIPSAFSERLITFIVREHADHFLDEITASVSDMFPNVLPDLNDRIRVSHNAMIAKPWDENVWIKALTEFNWTIESGNDFILPDAVALAREEAGQLSAMLFNSADDLSLVLMPVSPTRILVGRRNAEATYDVLAFNQHAASNSESFFVSASEMQDSELSALIGTAAAKSIDDVIEGAIRDAEATRSVSINTDDHLRPRTFSQDNFSYTVRLADFGDDALAKEYAEVLNGVVGTLARQMPLHELDGITLAVDYPRAVEDVDRGDPSLPKVVSGALAYGVGVAMPVTVHRDGTRKQHLVVEAGLAEAWLSTEPSERAASLYMLVKMLAGVAHTAQFITAEANRFTPDPMALEFHMSVATAPCAYWSSRQAAFIDASQGEPLAQLVLKSLEYAKTEVALQRVEMKDGTDVGPTVTRALECVSAILDHVANWLGHRDGLVEEDGFPGDFLPSQLQGWGLDRWLELFGRDLAACYTDEGHLDLSVVTTLSRHVERLLWAVGVYCWPNDDGVFCMVTEMPLSLLGILPVQPD